MIGYDWYEHEMPTALAYYSEKNARYECWNTNRCVREQATPLEVFRLYNVDESYIPYLRCPICEKLYFGDMSYNESEPVHEPEETITPPPPKPQPPHQEESIDLPNLFTV